MKAFLVRICLFTAIMALVLMGVELMLLLVPNEYSYRRHYVETHGHQIGTLILGNSLTCNGIVPEELTDSAFGCALNGKSNYIDRVFLDRYAPQLPNLHTVIFPIGYGLQLHAISEGTGIEDFGTVMLTKVNKYWDIPVDGLHKWNYWSELLNTRSSILCRFLFPQGPECEPSGWTPSSAVLPLDKMRADYTKHDYNSAEAKLRTDYNINEMLRIARTCKQYDIKLILVTPPYCTDIIDGITDQGLRQMRHCADTMMQAAGDVAYYDYMYDPRFELSDFHDATHLNPQGAHKFTKILHNEAFE